jgi:hypothetical protein
MTFRRHGPPTKLLMPPGPARPVRRRPASVRRAVAVLVAGVVAALLIPGLATPAAAAKPDFQLPLPCGQSWSLFSYDGHDPDDKKIDMQRNGGTTSGTPVLASAAGRVHQFTDPGGIEIDHGDGWFSLYLHMPTRTVSLGDRVDQGDQIGTVGNVGTRVPHLHYELRFDSNGNGDSTNDEIVYAEFDGVTYNMGANGQNSYNVTSNNCGGGGGADDPQKGVKRSAKSTGDFNGDGRDDAAIFYAYADGSVALWTFTGKADGGFNAPFRSWQSAPGNWYVDNLTLQTGDFNGDGRDDVGIFYGYADGSVALWSFLAKADGGFNAPTRSWQSAAGNWYFERVKLAAGDFNGDGRDDVGVFYGYADGAVALWTFTATAAGGFNAPVRSWQSAAGNWYIDHIKFANGDHNGDGRDDLSIFYGYADGSVALWTFLAKTDGGFNAPTRSWQSAAGNWYVDNLRLTSGDFNGDDRDDVAIFYGYSDGRVRLWTFTAKTDGGFNTPLGSWQAAAGSWYIDNVRFL